MVVWHEQKPTAPRHPITIQNQFRERILHGPGGSLFSTVLPQFKVAAETKPCLWLNSGNPLFNELLPCLVRQPQSLPGIAQPIALAFPPDRAPFQADSIPAGTRRR